MGIELENIIFIACSLFRVQENDCSLTNYFFLIQVEAELIDKLDTLVSEGKGDENYRELFSLL